jgi:cell division protein FtsI (penicillin-binding protein 3)
MEDEAREKSGEDDLKALYAAANELPSDDPLRNSSQNQSTMPSQTTALSNQYVNLKTNPGAMQTVSTTPQSSPSAATHGNAQPMTTAVMVIEAKSLRVPSLIGLPVRKVIEQAAAVGLEVHISGSGTVREQAPAPGTMVASGTQIVVRCGR